MMIDHNDPRKIGAVATILAEVADGPGEERDRVKLFADMTDKYFLDAWCIILDALRDSHKLRADFRGLLYAIYREGQRRPFREANNAEDAEATKVVSPLVHLG